jgi:hypothetical protein
LEAEIPKGTVYLKEILQGKFFSTASCSLLPTFEAGKFSKRSTKSFEERM